nr:hypothetical protein [Tanacetum cinerariifolium]
MSSSRAASEWFKKDCIGSVTTWEDLVEKFVPKLYQLSYNNEVMEADEDDNPDNVAEIFKINENLFDFKTPLTYEEHEYEFYNNIRRDLEEPWSDNGVPYQLNYRANNASDTQDSQEHKKKHHDPSVCRVRRFEMIKYSFDADDEYVAIKEHEYPNHSRTNIDA